MNGLVLMCFILCYLVVIRVGDCLFFGNGLFFIDLWFYFVVEEE